jgi:hypothetical protein
VSGVDGQTNIRGFRKSSLKGTSKVNTILDIPSLWSISSHCRHPRENSVQEQNGE